jgi:O-antigen/teichoic acid export membrane protein
MWGLGGVNARGRWYQGTKCRDVTVCCSSFYNKRKLRSVSSSLRSLFANGVYLFGGGAAGMGLALLQTLILARTLGPAHFGIWSGVQAYVLVAYSLCTFRTSEPVTRYLVDLQHRQDHGLLEVLLASALATDIATRSLALLVIVISVPWIAGMLPGGADAVPLYVLIGGAQLCGVFDQVWFSVARDLGWYRAIAALNAGFPLLRVGGLALLWGTGTLTLATAAWLTLLAGLIQFGVTGACLIRAMADGHGVTAGGLIRSSFVSRRREISAFWGFMGATFFSSIFSSMIKEADTLILGFCRPAEDVGWYRLGKSLAAAVMRVGEMLGLVIYQDFSELVVRRDMAEIRRRILLLCRTWLPLVAVGTVIGILIARSAIILIFGVAFEPATVTLQVLLAAGGIVTMLFWARPMVLALELYWYNLRITMVQGAVLLPLNVVLCQTYGIAGATATLALSWLVGCAALLWPLVTRLSSVACRPNESS